mgnify:FL=1
MKKDDEMVERILSALLDDRSAQDLGLDRSYLVKQVCIRASYTDKEKAEKVIDNALRRMKTKGLVRVVKERGRKPYWQRVRTA